MKIYFLLVIMLLLVSSGFSQNVGIGTFTPVFKLDVKNGSINTDSVYRISTQTVLSVRGTGNLLVGKNAGRINTGSNNTFSGEGAGYSNTVGFGNTAYGFHTLYSNFNGAGNTAIGFQTLQNNIDGEANTAIGDGALYYNTGGKYNTAGGYTSLYDNVDGWYNTANGESALTRNLSGSWNTAYGGHALAFNATGAKNTAIGYSALSYNESGTLNTGLGYNSDLIAGVLTNATAIGANARADCSNCMVLGSVTNINGATADVNVGIGVNSPNAKLSISSTGNELAGSATGNTLTTNAGFLSNAADSELSMANIGFMSGNNSSLGVRAYRTSMGNDWTSTALLLEYDIDNTARVNSSYLALNANGNLGIGTITPGAKLHIQNGASGATPFVFSRLAIESNGHTYINLLSPAMSESAILFGIPGSSANGGLIFNNENTPNGFQFRVNGNLTKMVLDAQGRLGIGNFTPQYPLSFNGTLGDKISLWTDGAATHYGLGVQNSLLQIFTKSVTDDVAFGYGNSTSMTETMRIKGNGKVGIGINAPLSALHVTSNSSTNPTCYFVNTSSNGAGVWANCVSTPGAGTGMLGAGGSIGVDGYAAQIGAGNRYGVHGHGQNGSDFNYGFNGSGTGGQTAIGVFGDGSGGSVSNWGGYFNGSVYSTGSYQGSDRKLKNDIKPLSGALSIINDLNPTYYTYKTSEFSQMHLPEGLHYGLIADEVLQVIPGAVKHAVQPPQYENNDVTGTIVTNAVEFDAVNYTEMIPILIGAVKEQQVLIEELKLKNQQIDLQQKQIAQLQVAIDELKTLVMQREN
jgi:energy-coupling factor transporter ATP-binding protein EcfA2